MNCSESFLLIVAGNVPCDDQQQISENAVKSQSLREPVSLKMILKVTTSGESTANTAVLSGGTLRAISLQYPCRFIPKPSALCPTRVP
jgi:hypothetical protein